MKSKKIIFCILCALLFCLSSCSKNTGNSSFEITFIDVGQGDSALIECDGKYMLIDGGETTAGEKVYDVLENKGVQNLEILAISHLHSDHIGGLKEALKYASNIKYTISNSDYSDSSVFRDVNHQLAINGTKITVPQKNQEYELGSATVKVIDVSDEERNDSLVLLITYKNTRFLFTGDIERNAQLRIVKYFENETDNKKWVSLIKMPHHGAYNDEFGFQDNALNRLFREYDPTYFVISAGKGNKYKHPHQETIDIIKNMVVDVKELKWDTHVKRTDLDGDIVVRVSSNGKEIQFEK